MVRYYCAVPYRVEPALEMFPFVVISSSQTYHRLLHVLTYATRRVDIDNRFLDLSDDASTNDDDDDDDDDDT